MKRMVWVLFTMVGGMVWLSRLVAAESGGPVHAPVWQSLPPGQIVSENSPNGALGPTTRYSGNGSQIITVYTKQITNVTDNDPYYSISTDNGISWSTPAAVYTSSGLNSVQVTAEFNNNTPYAVWVEALNDGNQNLLVAGKTGSSFAAPVIISQTAAPGFPMLDPEIATNRSELHVVWAQDFPTLIRHARSIDNGQTWLVTTVNPGSQVDGRLPDVVARGGIVHIVWEEDAPTGGGKTDIVYAQGSFDGNTMVWSTPIRISNDGNERFSKQPTIVLRGGGAQVAYTNLLTQVEPDPDLQNIYHTSCSNNCTDVANWSIPQIISGEFVSVNNKDPFFVVPDMAQQRTGNNTFIYFHGAPPDQSQGNEVIHGINSQDGWAQGGRDDATSPTMRSKNPSIDIQNCWIQMTYELFDGSTNQIYHMRGTLICALYLPVIRH